MYNYIPNCDDKYLEYGFLFIIKQELNTSQPFIQDLTKKQTCI